MAWSDPNHKRQHRRKRNPCGSNLPSNVSGIAGAFQRTEGTRGALLRLRVSWNHVGQTQAGEDYKPDAYGIQLWGSSDGTTWSKDNIRHKQVRGTAGADGDWDTADDTKVPNFVVFRNIKPRWYYKVRVRALSKKECDGTFGSWVTIGTANDNNAPDKPRSVSVSIGDKGRVVRVEWDAPASAISVINDQESNPHDIVDDAIAYYQVQVATNTAFTTNVKTDKMVVGERKTFRYTKDIGDTVYARVASYDAAGNSKGWTAYVSGSTSTPSGVGTITRTRTGPRLIEFDWADSTDPDFDRYKVIVLRATSSGGTYTQIGDPHYVRNSRYSVHVSNTDRTRWWKVRVTVETYPDASGTRRSSSDVDSTADQADDLSVTAGQVSASTLDEFTPDAGTITAGTFQGIVFTTDQGTTSDLNFIKIVGSTGSSDKDKVQFWSGTTRSNLSNSNIVATGGGIQIAGTTGQKVGFFGATPVARPTKISGDRSAELSRIVRDLLDALQSLGLITHDTVQ